LEVFMRVLFIGLTLFALTLFLPTLATAPVSGADLTKIDRMIAKEPAYKSQPKYCLLVFGLEARTRIWLVLDGDVLYADRNGNGNLMDKDEQIGADRSYADGAVFHVGTISTPEQKVRHTGLKLSVPLSPPRAAGDAGNLSVTIGGSRWYAPVKQFSDRPKDAPIIHFAGPLSFRIGEERDGKPPTLVIGKDTPLVVFIGTRGLGNGAFAWCKADEAVPAFSLQAEIEAPSGTPGGKPLITKVLIHPPDV
jgi:hypothetical protein